MFNHSQPGGAVAALPTLQRGADLDGAPAVAARMAAALAAQRAGDAAEAEAGYRGILADAPTHAPATHFLGLLLCQRCEFAAGVPLLRRSVELAPGSAAFRINLGAMLGQLDRAAEAIPHLREALRLEPGRADAAQNLGGAMERVGRIDDARAAFAQAVRLDPSAANLTHLARASAKLGQLRDAVSFYERALAMDSHSREALNALPGLYEQLGDPAACAGAYRRLIAADPKNPAPFGGLLFNLLHLPDYPADTLVAEHAEWNARHAAHLAPTAAHYDNDPDPDRPLRVAYVSPHFREHTVPIFLEPLLAAHDHRQVRVICYSDVRQPDATTRRLRALANEWHETGNLSHEQLAERVHSDRVDVLIELAGHMGDNRLLVFARRPAPVQITYIGYPHTTGVPAIGWRITDAVADPPGDADRRHVERLLRLDRCAWAYRPSLGCPPVSALPAARAGHVTFGSLNRSGKLGPGVLDAWASILLATPGSRLICLADGEDCAARIAEVLGRRGIPADRLETFGRVPRNTYLELCHRIDVALDPFPYNGMTTTCDMFWMGVPVIALAGETHVARVGLDLLTAVGLPDLAARSIEEYVALAVRLASDLPRLHSLRRSLRDRMRHSPLRDESDLAARVEQAYRFAWRDWCAQRKTAGG